MNDLIERKAAIDALLAEVRMIDGYYCEHDEVINKDDAVDAIKMLPSAEPKKMGTWISVSPMVDSEQCSECGYNIKSEELETPYCPWCGTPMHMSYDGLSAYYTDTDMRGEEDG